MEKYEVIMTAKSLKDFQKIIYYIKFKLREPNVAEKYKELILSKIVSLEDFPYKFEDISSKSKKHKGIRKVVVNNYSVFYRIKENIKQVSILRILYNGSDWTKKI